MKTLLSILISFSIITTKSDTLIGTYDVNYRWNTAGCAPPGGDFSNLLYGNPYSCVGSPGPYYIDAEPGRYKVVFPGDACSIWTSGHRTGGRGVVEFDHTFGQIVLYAWDWIPEDNPPTSIQAILYKVDGSDVSPENLHWNPSYPGGFEFDVKVEGAALTAPIELAAYFADGPTAADINGPAFYTATLPPSPVGTYGPFSVAGGVLTTAPPSTSHILVVIDPQNTTSDNPMNNVIAMFDVQLGFGINARADVLSEFTVDVLKDVLRLSGEASALITSTYRSPEDQARAMFNNLAAGNNVSYKGPGKSVQQVYERMVKKGFSAQEILDAMINEINKGDPNKISHHMGDFSKLQVVDIDPGPNSISNEVFFEINVQADSRITKFIPPPLRDAAHHIEIPQP